MKYLTLFKNRLEGYDNYFYNGTQTVEFPEPSPIMRYQVAILSVEQNAEHQRDRYLSGNFGCRVWDTLEQAQQDKASL